MKKVLISLAVALVLASGLGYGGYDYFKKHYILLDENDVVNLQMQMAVMQEQALQFGYATGKDACNKTL